MSWFDEVSYCIKSTSTKPYGLKTNKKTLNIYAQANLDKILLELCIISTASAIFQMDYQDRYKLYTIQHNKEI